MFFIDKYTKNNEHIYFFETKSNFNSSFPTNNTDSQTLYLLNSRYNINFFQIIPRKFKIIAEESVYYFNIDILKDTSQVITDLHYRNSDSFELLSSIYDFNVLSKFEKLYNGQTVSFKKREMKQYNIFKTHLKIDCIPKLTREKFEESDKVYLQMEKNNFVNYLKKLAPKTFTISTKKNEYKCNVFGILVSDVLLAYVTCYPEENSFYYDFDDENNEFSLICSLFNFEYVKMTNDNIESLKIIADDLDIKCIKNDINDNYNNVDKISQVFDNHQDEVDSIDNLFDSLCNIEKEKIPEIQNQILNSSWIKKEETVQELAAFILQVIRSDFLLHHNLVELLISLDRKEKYLNTLIPFIVDKLISNFGNEEHECSFIYLLNKNGIISNKLLNMKLNEKINTNFDLFNIITWFLPEISKLVNINDRLKSFNSLQKQWINIYYPSNLDQYEKMRDSGEPDDSLTIALRHDDIKQFQAIITFNNFDLSKGIVPYNIFEDFIDNGKTNYLDYAAAYGSVRCFKYLFLNHQKINDLTFSYAIYGGNTEIVRIVYQQMKGLSNDMDIIKKNLLSPILKHRNNLFDWVFEQIYLSNCDPDLLMELMIESAKSGNIHSLIEIIEMGHLFDSIDKQRSGWGFYQSRNILKFAIESSSTKGFCSVTQIIFDIIKDKNELFIIRNITPYTDFGNLSILKTVKNSVQVQSKYGVNQEKDSEWFICSVKNNNLNIINYMLNEKNLKLCYIFDDTILQCLQYCNTEYHANLFKLLANQLMKRNSKSINKIVEILPIVCRDGNYYAVSNIVDFISNSKYILEYDVTDSYLNASIAGSKQICNLLLNCSKFTVYFDQFLNNIDQLATLEKDFFMLIYKNSSYKAKCKYLQTILYPAIIKGNIKLIKYLLKLNPPIDESLFYAVNSHSLETVDLILDHYDSPDFVNKYSSKGTALCVAAKNQDLDILCRLLSVPEIDASLSDEQDNTPLLIAIKNKDIDIAKAILDFYGEKINQIEIDKCLNQLFKFYKENNDIIVLSMVDFLIKKIASIKSIDPNIVYSNNNSIFFYAIENNDSNFVKNLLQLDHINPNIYTNHKHITPLMFSIKKMNSEIAEILIKNPKTNINYRNHHKKTALVMAVKRNLCDIIDMLILSKKFNRRESNIKLAFTISNTETLKHLVKVKSLDVNILINNKTTKLIEATKKQDLEMIDLIINHRSFDKNQSKLDKAFLMALKNNYEEIIKKFIPMLDDINKYKLDDNDLLSICQNYQSSVEIFKLIFDHPSFDIKKYDLDKAIDIAMTKNNIIILNHLKSEKNRIILVQSKSTKSTNKTDKDTNGQNKSNKSVNKTDKETTIQKESNKSANKTNKDTTVQNESNKSVNKTDKDTTIQKESNKSANKTDKDTNVQNKSNKSVNKTDKDTTVQKESNKSVNKTNKDTTVQNESNEHHSESSQNKRKSNSNKNKADHSNQSTIKTVKSETNKKQNKSELNQTEDNKTDSNPNKLKTKSSSSKNKASKSSVNQSAITLNQIKKPNKADKSNQSEMKSIQSETDQRPNKSDLNQNEDNTTKSKLVSSMKKQSSRLTNKISQEKLFNGILSHLINKSNNIIEDTVKISCSSCFDFNEFNPENVINYEDKNKSFWSKIMPNNWLCFEFTNKHVIPSCYRIRSCNLAKNCSHPKSWVIEGSNDNDKSWSIIDQVENCSFLNGPGIIHLFRIKEQPKQSFKSIRMRLIDVDWYGTESLMIESFELFGTLLKKPKSNV